MQTIGEILNSQQSRKPTGQTYSQSALTLTKPEIVEAFKKKYPTKESIAQAFVPENCQYFMGDREQKVYLNKPCIRLSEIGKVYGNSELAVTLVKQHIRAVYGMSGAKYTPDEQWVNITAGRFIGKYGMTCTLYEMMIYFACFGTDFRTSWSSFDYNDIIKGFKEKFRPWANERINPYTPMQEEKKDDLTGELALAKYISDEVQKLGCIDAFIAQSGMYTTGMLTRESIEKNIKLWASYSNKPF